MEVKKNSSDYKKVLVQNEEILPNLLKVLKLLKKSIKEKKKKKKLSRDLYSIIATQAIKKFAVKSTTKECIDLTCQALFSHRFMEATKLLWMLCQDRSVYESFIFRTAMIILESDEDIENKPENSWKFFRSALFLKNIITIDVILEFIIYSLRKGIPDTQEKTEVLLSSKKILQKKCYQDFIPIFKAYYSFLKYVEWQNTDPGLSSQADRHIDELVLKFQQVIDTPGNWDIFVLRLVKILETGFVKHEYMASVENPLQNDTIKDVLVKYADVNRENLNAHIYLCNFLSTHEPESEELIDHLEIVADMCPSDESVLLLIEKLQVRENQLVKRIRLIFMFLDYPSNSQNVKAWNTFSHLLSVLKLSDKEIQLEVKKCWNYRKKNWLFMYFNLAQLRETEPLLFLAKADVLSHFEKNHPFIQKVYERFHDS